MTVRRETFSRVGINRRRAQSMGLRSQWSWRLHRFGALIALAISLATPQAATAQTSPSDNTLYLSALLRTANPTARPPGVTPQLTELAIVGDSTQDEYQAPENSRPAYNWVEVLARTRDLPLGNWGTWGGSRRTGYEFDWALSGATSADALNNQVPGVAAQLRNGTVSHVLLQIGINDFNAGELSLRIYAGVPIGTGPLDAIADNIIASARQLNAAAPGSVIVASIQDYLLLDLLPDPANASFTNLVGRKRVIDAFAYVNNRVRVALHADGIALWDFNEAMAAELAPRRQGNLIAVDDQWVDIRHRGSEPVNGFVDDAYMHPGSALSGLFAKLYIERMNAQWGLGIAPLTDSEIMGLADALP